MAGSAKGVEGDGCRVHNTGLRRDDTGGGDRPFDERK